jgi:hypothetical protein
VALGWLWGGFGVALWWLWGGFRVPIGWLSTRFRVALMWLWVASPGRSAFEVQGSTFKVQGLPIRLSHLKPHKRLIALGITPPKCANRISMVQGSMLDVGCSEHAQAQEVAHFTPRTFPGAGPCLTAPASSLQVAQFQPVARSVWDQLTVSMPCITRSPDGWRRSQESESYPRRVYGECMASVRRDSHDSPGPPVSVWLMELRLPRQQARLALLAGPRFGLR